jgi:hypothetical protein
MGVSERACKRIAQTTLLSRKVADTKSASTSSKIMLEKPTRGRTT